MWLHIKSLSLLCVIVERRYVLIRRSVEKDLSADAVVTGIVKNSFNSLCTSDCSSLATGTAFIASLYGVFLVFISTAGSCG